jgi:hypothetical protein
MSCIIKKNSLIGSAFFLTISLLYVCSCEDPVILNLPVSKEKLVVNGWITNQNKSHEIVLNQTVSFNSSNVYPAVSGSAVYITDRLSFRYDFIEIGNTGIYKSDSLNLIGKQGEAYTLHIVLSNGKEYESIREVLHQLPELKELSSDFFFDAGLPIDNPDAKKFFLQGQIQDLPNIRNYYRWKISVNGEERNSPKDLFLFDDKFTDGILFNIKAINVTMKIGDQVTLQHASLTEKGYKYFEQLSDQLSSGIIPNAPPSIILGNIKNIKDSTEIVLGYFGASAVSVSQIDIIL